MMAVQAIFAPITYNKISLKRVKMRYVSMCTEVVVKEKDTIECLQMGDAQRNWGPVLF